MPQPDELLQVKADDDVGALRRDVQLAQVIEKHEDHEVGAVELCLRGLARERL